MQGLFSLLWITKKFGQKLDKFHISLLTRKKKFEQRINRYPKYNYFAKNKSTLLEKLLHIFDFEKTIINAEKFIFPEIKIIGCLFHFNNALWRWAHANKLGNKEVIDKTSIVIDKVVALCWKPTMIQKTIQDLKIQNSSNKDLVNFLNYVTEQYGKYFEDGILDYTDSATESSKLLLGELS